MEFNIKGLVKEDGLPNTFVVEIKWMHGDADGYTTTVSKPFKKGADEWALEEFVLAMEDLWGKYQHEHENNEHYRKWFNREDYDFGSKEAELRYLPFVSLDVERDLTYGDFSNAKFNGYTVYYFDENMLKYEVEVKVKVV